MLLEHVVSLDTARTIQKGEGMTPHSEPLCIPHDVKMVDLPQLA